MSRFADLVIKEDRSVEEDRELHILAQQLEYITNDLGTVIGPSGTVARLRAGSVTLDNAGMHTYLGGVETGRIEADGDFLLGSNIATAATTSFVVFSNAQTYNSESIGAGDLLIGDNSSGKANILWDKSAGTLLFRGGTTTKGYISTDGAAYFGAGNVRLDNVGLSFIGGAANLNQIKWLESTYTGLYGWIYTNIGGSTPNRYGAMQLSAWGEDGGTGPNQVVIDCYHQGITGEISRLLLGTSQAIIELQNTGSSATNDAPEIIRLSRFTTGVPADGYGLGLHFYGEDNLSGAGLAPMYMGDITVDWDDALHASRKAAMVFSVTNAGTVDERLRLGVAEVVFNDGSDDVDHRFETNNFPYAFGTDGGTDSITMALDVRGASGTAYPAVGINTPLPQQLFEVHRATWNQTADMEEGNTTDFDGVTENGSSTFTATEASKKNGTHGVSVVIDGSQNTAYGTFTDPSAETTMVLESWVNPTLLTMATNDVFNAIMTIGASVGGKSATGFMELKYDGSDYSVSLVLNEDDGTGVATGYHTITAGWNLIRLILTMASGAGINDGNGHLYIDGVPKEVLTGLDNDLRVINSCSFGARSAIDAGTSGTLYMDDCKWRSGGGIKVTGGGVLAQNSVKFGVAGPTDDLDVSGINVLFIDTSANNVILGGTSGGVDGQVLHIIVHDKTRNFTIENEEPGATQKFFLHAGSDETLTAEYGGWTFICDGGEHWHDASHAKHV